MRYLLDGSVLIALADREHTAHVRATKWFQDNCRLFATCPITQEALCRVILVRRSGSTIQDAKALLALIEARDGHEFWPDSISYSELPEAGVWGHKQVTDAYLIALARHHHVRLATLDRALATIHPDVAVLIP